MSVPLNHEEALFERALGLDSPAAREAFLREACGQDTALRERLLGLLRAHDRAGKFLEHREPSPGPESRAGILPAPAAPAANETAPPPDADTPSALGRQDACPTGDAEAGLPRRSDAEAGDRIGRYKLLEQIGEGGMGVVWMAEQEEPVRRRVALKIIKPGMDTREVVARFEAERQALALMDHPNIARVFDGGATGHPLPSDGRGAGGEGLVNSQLSTPHSQLPSGRPYFVMELVRGLSITKYCDQAKLSTRQRLELFGQVCRAVQHAHQKGIIHRDLKPSNILVTEQDGRPVPKVIDFGIAKATGERLTDKTLFTAFAQLIGTPAYMSPEQAGLGSLDIDTRSDTYSLGVVLYQLLTGHTPFDTQALLKSGFEEVLRTIREVDPPKPSTRLNELIAADVRSRTCGEGHESAFSRRRLQEVRGDLDWIVMKCLEKDRNRRYDTANAVAQDLERYLHDEPIVARPPSALYRWQKFARKHRVAVAVTAGFLLFLTVAAVVSTALALWANQERSRASQAEKDALSNARQAREAEAEAKDTLRFFESTILAATRPAGQHGGLGREVTVRAALDAAEPQIRQAFTNRPLAEASVRETLGMTYYHLDAAAQAAGQLDRALSLRHARLGQDDPQTLNAMNRLAMAQITLGQLADAERLLEQALMRARANPLSDDSDVFNFMDNLATVYARTGRHSNAVALLETVLEGVRAQRGLDDPSTLRIMNNLANAYGQVGQRKKALPLLEETWQRTRDKLGVDNPDTLSAMNNLSVAYRSAGQFDQAVSLSERAVRLGEDKLGREHLNTLTWRRNLALAYRDLQRTNDALRHFAEIVDVRKRRSDPDPSDLFRSQKELAQYCVELDRLGEAQSRWQTLLDEQRKRLAPDDIALAETLSGLGDCLLRQGNHEQAEPLLMQAWDGLKKPEGERPTPSRAKLLKATAGHLTQLYQAWNKPEEAAKWRGKLP